MYITVVVFVSFKFQENQLQIRTKTQDLSYYFFLEKRKLYTSDLSTTKGFVKLIIPVVICTFPWKITKSGIKNLVFSATFRSLKMGKSAKCQIISQLLCVAVLVLVPCLVLNCFLGFGLFAFIVTIPILLLSTAFLITFSKKQQQNIYVNEKVLQDENPICYSTRNFLENEPEEKMEQVIENVEPINGDVQESEVSFVHEPEDFPSDSESIDDDSVSSENFEIDWIRCNNVNQNGVISSDSVSEDDEDSLIEIAIPGSDHSTCNSLNEEEPKQKMQTNNLPDDFLPESFMRQQGLLELFADVNEVNEEENLIEIDISVGSIKCSSFEIEGEA